MLLMCFSVAPSVIPSSVAIPWFVRPFGHRRQDLPFAGREHLERVVAAPRGHQLGDHLGVQGGAAAGHAPERVHELAHVADPVLEEIADAAGAIGEQLRRVLALHVLAEDQHRRSRNLPASLDRRAQSFVALARWHPHVDDGYIRAMREDGVDERGPVADLGDDHAA